MPEVSPLRACPATATWFWFWCKCATPSWNSAQDLCASFGVPEQCWETGQLSQKTAILLVPSWVPEAPVRVNQLIFA